MCEYCKDLNDEKEDMEVDTININSGYFNYSIPIKFCPACGTILNKYKKENMYNDR